MTVAARISPGPLAMFPPPRAKGGGAMERARVLVVAVVMAVPILGMAATPAHACMGEVCDAINFVCAKAFKGAHCVG